MVTGGEPPPDGRSGKSSKLSFLGTQADVEMTVKGGLAPEILAGVFVVPTRMFAALTFF